MSIFNAFVAPDHVLIGFDTDATQPDGSYTERCKTIFLPHLGAVIGFRGIDFLFANAAPALLCFSGSFDDLCEHLPAIIGAAMTASQKDARAVGANPDEAFDFCVVGFSPRLGRMTSHTLSGSGESHDSPQIIAPGFGEDWIRGLGVYADRAGMIALALDQCRLVRQRDPGLPAGGRLFIAEMRQGSITVDEVCRFPEREVLA